MKNWLLLVIAFAALTAGEHVCAADLPRKFPVKTRAAATYANWTGFYFGGYLGYGTGTFGPGTNAVQDQGGIFRSTLTGNIGGPTVGYNFQLANKLVVGVETDLAFTSPRVRPPSGVDPFTTTFDYFGTVRARAGYALGNIMPFVTGGVAYGQTKLDSIDASGNIVASKSVRHVGWTAGAGVEYALKENWTAKFEYDYLALGTKAVGLVAESPVVNVTPAINVFKLGLNYRLFGDASGVPSEPPIYWAPTPKDSDWNIHGQTTAIEQGYFRIRSPYQGANSLPAGGQGRETVTATAFVGWRPWAGGEIYIDPEMAQGFGLAGTLGLGAFSNGEAQKAGAEIPKIRVQRYFFRQTWGLGGGEEDMEDGPNQLPGKRDVDRITLTIGRIAIGDIFDNNTYAHDPRADFQNWAMWSSAAYDFPADLPGFTRGAVVELNRKDWALRAGFFQVPAGPNSDVLTFDTGGAVVELEERYNISDRPGKLRLGAFINQGRTGSYQEALALAAAAPTIDINSAMANTRRDRPKNGFYVNLEQAVNKDVGLFARASWNDGKTEILSFTDIDKSISGGISIKGSSWGRQNDTIGIGGAINGLSSQHRAFLAAGGLGLLIGDGALNYRQEKIFEAYYAINLAKGATLSVDYQYVANPAYNADRGPVSIYATRLHGEF